MKAILAVLLSISIVFSVCVEFNGVKYAAHNNWIWRWHLMRQERPKHSRSPQFTNSAYSGLYEDDLAALDPDTSFAYTMAVSDGVRIGKAYETVRVEAHCFNALVFVLSIVGLLVCRNPNAMSAGPVSRGQIVSSQKTRVDEGNERSC